MKYIDTFEEHAANPGESVEQYVKRRRIQLAQEIRCAKKIYLDTNFWIWLRDARLGHPRSDQVNVLLRTLKAAVEAKKALCPLSVDTFAEVFKQTIPSSRRATLELIDELSMGVSMIEFGERFQLEAFHFIREKGQGADRVHSLDDLVWTKTAYVLGFVTPTFPKMPGDLSTIVQKAFVDQMWVITLVDMVDQMGPDNDDRHEGWFPDNIAERLNEGKLSSTHEYSSFKQLFLNELAGILDLHKPVFANVMRRIYESETGKVVTSEEAEVSDAGRLAANLIYNAFRSNKIKSELPSFRVHAGLHAAMRWDLNRKWKRNDLHDIHHAVSAIPYCDWFFTEHSLRHLISNKNLELSSFFKCKTLSDVDEALSVVSQLGG